MNKEQLQFFYDEIMGLFGWGDEEEETGVDPLLWAREQLAQLRAELDLSNKLSESDGRIIVSLRDIIKRLRAELDNWEEREGAVCPEDVGFDEYIPRLADMVAQKNIELLAKENALEEAREILFSSWPTMREPSDREAATAWLSAHPAQQEEK